MLIARSPSRPTEIRERGNAIAARRHLSLFAMAAALTILGLGPLPAIADDVRPGIDNRDAIESAVAPGFGAEAAVTDHFNILLGDQFTYDDNVYRLPTGTNVEDRVG